MITTPAHRPLKTPRRRLFSGKQWSLDDNGSGWIVFHRPYRLRDNEHPLTHHADWAGPVKLVESADGRTVSLRYDFFLDESLGHEGDPAIDAELAEENEALAAAFGAQAEAFHEAPRLAGWTPPPVEALAGWLRRCGYEPTEDEEQNLRLSIRRRGATGQVKLVREEGRLRLSMPLGRWGDLPNENRHAMQKLASLANARCRLARITWESQDRVDACEARVDLSGLPSVHRQSRRMESYWREMPQLAMEALDLAVRQLAMELAVLAEDKDQELVKRAPW